jgi:hypothetical protein
MKYVQGSNIDSLFLALLFERKVRKLGVRQKAHREPYNGTWALTWRRGGRGIIDIMFHDSGKDIGLATWAAYLPSRPETSDSRKYKGKGRFSVINGIPVGVFAIIKEITDDE